MARSPKLDPPGVDPANAEPEQPAARPSKLAAPRFSIQLTEGDEDEQAIDLAKMQKGNREKLAALLKRGDTLKQLGVVTEPTAALDPGAASALDSMLGAKAVELVGLLAVIGGQRALKLTPEASALLAFTPQQREALAPMAVRILSKYNLLGGKYAEEMAAAALAVAMLADNYQKAKAFDGKQPSLPLSAA